MTSNPEVLLYFLASRHIGRGHKVSDRASQGPEPRAKTHSYDLGLPQVMLGAGVGEDLSPVR